jgi:uncharacterized membrane protein YqhA
LNQRTSSPLERGIWNSRHVMIVAVVVSLIVAVVMLYVATVDAVYLLGQIPGYASPVTPPDVRTHVHAVVVARVAQIVDGYLFAAIMVIFGLGLYELFIKRIAVSAEDSQLTSILMIRDIDDLKERLAKVVFLILLVRYFEYALDQPVGSSLDLLYLALGIGLVALSIYLTARSSSHTTRPR